MNDLSATERCVKCGLCLPHCPTFLLTGNEADSPRGRISLMQMLDLPDTAWSPGLFRHLDQCLMCHACEAMCPSNVPYDALMDAARQRLEQQRQRTGLQRLASTTGLALLTTRGGRKLGAAGLGMIRLFGLHRMPGLPARLRRLLNLVPGPVSGAKSAGTSVTPATRGAVNLFTGCSGELFDPATLQAVRRLLGRLGYSVNVPVRQGCCGALHQHSGQPRRARQLALTNIDAFAGNDDPVLGFASGCCAHLLNYASLYPGTGDFSSRTTDIVTFLITHHTGELAFRPLQEKVAVYIPCTQRNVLGSAALTRLLAGVPGLQTRIVNPDGGCCGAAGSYMLTQAEMSDRLRDTMVDRVIATGARILLTTNIGCSLQLGAGLRQRGADVEVMHPVTLLDTLLA
jgi:glycolate dehydrogenase iron-sulfur subunit